MKTFLTIVLVFAGCIAPAFSQLPPGADTLFSYRRSAVIDLRDSLIESTDKVEVRDISYAGPRGGRVTGYLVSPQQKGKWAGVVFGHWGPGSRTEFLPEAKLYAQCGAVSVMIDYPWVRPAEHRVNQGRGFAEPEKDLAVFSQTVVELRRAVDILFSRPDVDSGRVAYVGHSYGAQWGAILSAIEKRLKTVVLMAGVPSDSVFIIETDDPSAVAFRESSPEAERVKYMKTSTVPLAAISYVPHAAPTPLFFQFALKERDYSIQSMNRYYNAASEPKTIKWYDTGHELNDPQALIDRAAWLAQYIRLAPIKPLVEQMMK